MKLREDKEFYKAFAVMTIVMALQNLIVFGVNLADSVMLGSYSELALDGSAVCNQIQFLLQMVATGISNGMVVMCSQYWGKREIKPIHRIFAVSLWLGIIISLLMTAAAAVIPLSVVKLFTDDAQIAVAAVEYISIIKYTYLIFTVTVILTSVLRSAETVRIGFYVSLSSLVINIFLNYVLIYGKLGFPELGIKGAAIATLISRVMELIVTLIYVFAIDKKLKLRLEAFIKIEGRYIKDFIKTGIPLTASSISWGIAMSIQGIIIGRLGGTAISANSIATTIFQVATVVIYASGSAACVLTGKSIGENCTIELIKKRSVNMQIIFLIAGILSSALLFGFKSVILDYYNTSAETRRMTEIFIYILCVTIVGTAYECPVLTGIVSGGGETDFVFKNDIIFMWLIILPVSALSAFVFKFPVPVTFACLKADQVLKCAVAAVKVNRWKWIKKIA